MAHPRPIYEIEADFAAADIYVFSDRPDSRSLTRDLVHTFGKAAIRDFDSLSECVTEAMDMMPRLIILDLAAVSPVTQVQLQRLRNDRNCCHLPLLVRAEALTGWQLAQLIHSGASDVVMSSLHNAQCMARVKTLLAGKAEPPRLPGKGVFQAIQDAQADLCRTVLPDAERLKRIQRHYHLDMDCLFLAQAGVGGDLWDVMPIDAKRVAVYCADFCGHGLHVAPHTLRLAGLMRSNGYDRSNPSEVLAWVNDRLAALLPAGQFAAMAYAVIDIAADEIAYSCSAHMPPMLKAAADAEWQSLEGSGLPLGFMSGVTYDTHRYPFAPDARFMLHSDALVETPMPPKARFSPDSLRVFCNGLPAAATPAEINAVLVAALNLGQVALEDDLTIMTMRRR